MFLEHLRNPKFLAFRIFIIKKNLDRLIIYCSVVTPLLMVTLLMRDFSKPLLFVSTLMMIVYFACILTGIYIQKKHSTVIRYYVYLNLTFMVTTILWLISFTFFVDHFNQFLYLYVLIFLMLSSLITIFPIFQALLSGLLTLVGCNMVFHIDLEDPYYCLVIVVLGIYTFVSNHSKYLQIFKCFNQQQRHIEDLDMIKSLKHKDHLTNLYNNKYIFEQMENAIQLYKRYHSPFSIMLIDIDNFRTINEKYGQVFGDEVIVTIANMLITACRDTDLPARYSGKKLLLLMQNTNLNDSILIAERVRLICQEHDFDVADPITVSIGLKSYNGSEIHEFIDGTHLLVREAKLNGKNNIQY